jgi:bacillithiol system protein YtxJ
MVPTPTSSDSTFVALERPDQIETLVAESRQHPVVIFKHSTTCGTSAQAYDEMDEYLRERGASDVYLIDVHASRSLARDIAARFGVRHESPQLLLLVDGAVQWHASHYRVTAQELERALGRAQQVG